MQSSLGFLRSVQYRHGAYEHQITAAMTSLHDLKITCGEVMFPIRIPHDVRWKISELLNYNNIAKYPMITIHLGSKQQVKKWPMENYIDLSKRIISANKSIKIVLVGGKDDEETGRQFVNEVGERAVSLVGQTTLMETAEILNRCKLFIGNDSGPMHLAVAVQVPVIGIFSSIVFPIFWFPWGTKSIMIRNKVACQYCFTSSDLCPKGTYECIRGIRVEDVFKHCLKIIACI